MFRGDVTAETNGEGGDAGMRPTIGQTFSYDKVGLSTGTFPARNTGKQERDDWFIHRLQKNPC